MPKKLNDNLTLIAFFIAFIAADIGNNLAVLLSSQSEVQVSLIRNSEKEGFGAFRKYVLYTDKGVFQHKDLWLIGKFDADEQNYQFVEGAVCNLLITDFKFWGSFQVIQSADCAKWN